MLKILIFILGICFFIPVYSQTPPRFQNLLVAYLVIGTLAALSLLFQRKVSGGKGWDYLDSIFDLFNWLYCPGRIESRQDVFFSCVISLLAKVYQSERVIPEELTKLADKFMDEKLGFNSGQKDKAIKVFREARSSSRDFESYLHELYQTFRREPSLLIETVEILLEFSCANGRLEPDKERLILLAVRRFGIKQSRYESIREVYTGEQRKWTYQQGDKTFEHRKNEKPEQQKPQSPEERYYAILGCNSQSSNEEIKKNYRLLAKEHHPDIASGKGLPREFIERAKRKFQEIQNAYEVVSKLRASNS